jgi:ABC-type uncharacterized transport system auxiliary subunit
MRIRRHFSLSIRPLARLAGRLPRPGMPSAIIAVLVVLLSGCAKPRAIKYYQITYPSNISVSPEAIDTALLVRSFEASHLYLDDRVVYGYDSPEMGTYEDQRWAEPPVEMLRDAIVRGLRSSGTFKGGVHIARSELSGRYLLSGHLYDFKELDAATISARLSFEARLWDRKTRTLIWSHWYSYDERAAEKTVSAVAAAMDRNVQRSVQAIGVNLTEYFKAHPPQP